MVRVLVSCECSGRIRQALRDNGIDAWSCDLKEAEDGSPYHIHGDAIVAARSELWDWHISHPVCRFMAHSGSKHLYIGGRKENGPCPERHENCRQGAAFFRTLWDIPVRYGRAFENPIIHGTAREMLGLGRPTQIIQPWMFGHTERKGTSLWLDNLPKLVPTNNVREEMLRLPMKEQAKVHYMRPGPDREANRSRTYEGVAEAIGQQWGDYMLRTVFV